MNELIRNFQANWPMIGCMVIVIVLLLSIRHHRNKTTAKIVYTGMDNSIESWHEFYKRYFSITVNFSSVRVPNNPGNLDRTIFTPKGLKFKDVLKAMTRAGIKWKTYFNKDDLDKLITDNVRNPTEAYAIRCRERVEADEELRGLSANQLKAQGVNCMTALERAVYGLKYFVETGKHLDTVGYTTCVGSRDSNGRVPCVDCEPLAGEVSFDCCHPDNKDDVWRARQVVSL